MYEIAAWVAVLILTAVGVAGVGRTRAAKVAKQVKAGEHAWEQRFAQLGDADALLEMAFDRSLVGAAVVEADGLLSRCNTALASMFGSAPDELEGKPLSALVGGEGGAFLSGLFSEIASGERDRALVEHAFHCRDGRVIWAELAVSALRDGSGRFQRCLAQVRDETDRRRSEELRAHEALHDPLTGLPNRTWAEMQMTELMRVGRPFALAYFDLYRFKQVNDSLGRGAGDELLASIALRLSRQFHSRWWLARLVGDEFLLVCPGEGTEGLQVVARSVASALSEPFEVRGHRHAVGVTMGMTSSKYWHRHPDEVLREAHSAMLRAKAGGRGRVETYDPDQDNPASMSDLELEEALRQSLAHGVSLIPYFQPVVALPERSVVGHEALARWVHPRLGTLEPASFLPLAESTGLVSELGWHMLRASCDATRRLPSALQGGLWVAVNVAADQLGRNVLLPAVHRALSESGIEPSLLHLEITETALVKATPVVVKELSELAEMGVAIALDDFGTGYSSLSMLRDLPVDVVKIDKSFVAPLAYDRATAAIVHRIIQLCGDLGIVPIAEGIETEAQVDRLAQMGCCFGQGYLFGHPKPVFCLAG